MGKIVKLTQSDIENIVTNIIKEGEFDDFDTQIQPEELPGANEPDMSDFEDDEMERPVSDSIGTIVVLGKDGKHYVLDTKTGDITGVK